MKLINRLFWPCALITLLNAFTSAAFSVAALLGPAGGQVNAMYGLSRSVSLALITVLVIVWRSYPGLLILSLIMTLIQVGDALIGFLIQDTQKTVGPALLAITTGSVGLLLYRSVGGSVFKRNVQ